MPVGVGVEFDPYSRECMEDPYPVYRELLADAPVYRSERRDFWAVSRHADVQRCARDWETFSSREGVDLSGSVGLAGPAGFSTCRPPDVVSTETIVTVAETSFRVNHLLGSEAWLPGSRKHIWMPGAAC